MNVPAAAPLTIHDRTKFGVDEMNKRTLLSGALVAAFALAPMAADAQGRGRGGFGGGGFQGGGSGFGAGGFRGGFSGSGIRGGAGLANGGFRGGMASGGIRSGAGFAGGGFRGGNALAGGGAGLAGGGFRGVSPGLSGRGVTNPGTVAGAGFGGYRTSGVRGGFIGNRGGFYGARRYGYRRGFGYGGLGLGLGLAAGYGLASSYPYSAWDDPYYGSGYGYGGGYAPAAFGTEADVEPSAEPISGTGDQAASCSQRYKSYDPRSRTFLGYDGRRHPCP